MKKYNKIIRNIKVNLGYDELTNEEFIKAFHVTNNIANVELENWYDEETKTILDAEFIHLIDPDTNIEGLYMCNDRRFYNKEDFIIEW